MALTAMELIPALSPYRVGEGNLTAEVFGLLEILARAILPSSPGSVLSGDLSETAVAYIVLHLFESRAGDLDKASVNALGYSYSRNGNVPAQKTSYWLSMEQLANLNTKQKRGTGGLIERADKTQLDMRLDNAGIPTYAVPDDTYTGG
jgi:hypothetical protein